MKKHWNLTILDLIKKNFISLEPIDLLSVKIDQIVISDKFKHNNEGLKYFIGYQEDGIVKPLWIILHQISGYINTLNKEVKTCLFWLKMIKYGINTIKFGMWLKGINLHSEPAYEYKYLKAKVREFDVVIKTKILGNNIPKKIYIYMHYTWIACITIDSVMKIDKKIICKLI